MNTTNAAMMALPATTARILTPIATDLDTPPVFLPLLLDDPPLLLDDPALPLDDPALLLPESAVEEGDDVSTGLVGGPVADDADVPVPILLVCVAPPEETPTLAEVALTLFALFEIALAPPEVDVGVVELDGCSDADDESALDVGGDVWLAPAVSV
jgi:hypothetical protein